MCFRYRPHLFFIACLVVAMILTLVGGTVLQARSQWWQEKPAPASGDLDGLSILDPAAWQITDPSGKPVDPVLEKIGPYAALGNHTNQEIFVTGLTRYAPNTEITARVKLTPPANSSSTVIMDAALTSPDDPSNGAMYLNITASDMRGSVNYSCWCKDKAISGVYKFKPEFQRRLNWPETVRKTVEQNSASLISPEEKWLTVRLVLKPKGYQFYLDDRLIEDKTVADLDVRGFARLRLSPHASLAGVSARHIDPDPLFQPVALGGYLNAAEIKGKRIRRDSLPQPEKTIRVRNIPFEFPQPDLRGNDHIDLEKSWAYFADLETYMETMDRWEGAFTVNPARINLAVPCDVYSNIHLICAADGDKDSVPIVTAQFYMPTIGFPVNFAARAPLFTAKASEVKRLPVTQEGGGKGNLYLVTIPIDSGKLSSLVGWEEYLDLPTHPVYGGNGARFEIELTKEVKQYRQYPDPICYDFHQGGPPSGVHIYAMTLERPPVQLDFRPDSFSHIWTAPDKPGYTVTLNNRTALPRKVELALTTISNDEIEKTTDKKAVEVPANGDLPVKFTLDLKKYGYQKVAMTMTDAGRAWTENRSLVLLHPDTRERGDWDHNHGALFSCCDWGAGYHCGPGGPGGGLRGMRLMFDAGAESARHWVPDLVSEPYHEEAYQLAIKAGLTNTNLIRSGTQRPSNRYYSEYWTPNKEGWTPDVAARGMIDIIKDEVWQPGLFNKPEFIQFWAEPYLGPISDGQFADYWGEPAYVLNENERKTMEDMSHAFIIASKAIKKEWPQAKVLMPYGDPLFIVPFLRAGILTPDVLDGMALDIYGFERMPEMQLHQGAIHRMYQLREEYKKFGLPHPYLISTEGPFIPTLPGAMTYQEQADLYTRNTLMLMAYGVDQFFGSWQAFDYASYYGGEHYGNAGIIERIPHVSPKQGYAAFATMTRHLNRRNFEKWIPVGSLSTYCLQFKHYKSGELVHVLWTIRGKRSVSVRVPAGASVVRYDQMDNAVPLAVKDGRVTFEIEQSPCYVHGLGDNPSITLGDADHADSAPAAGATRIANPGDGTWTLSSAEDKSYADNHPMQIFRKVGKMSIRAVEAPVEQGGKALAVRLENDNKPRPGMPYYTTLLPKKPIVIPGKASHLGLWVRAASDWGRVVYSLRDAKGERWISIGSKEQYNCDDTHSWSFFNFDGWRYLRFELPSNSPYDIYREVGSTWWGHPEAGDGVIDLPLSLEKIIVERRTHVMYVNDPRPARTDDVLLGDLYAEYEKPEDKTAAVVKLSRLRMPVPPGVPELGNPIAELAATGVGEPTRVLEVVPPSYQPDGTRCHVKFDTVAGAQSYDVWVSTYPDGTGALKLGSGWKESGMLLSGLRPAMDFYLFVVYTDRDGKLSKPSAPLKIRLQDLFTFK